MTPPEKQKKAVTCEMKPKLKQNDILHETNIQGDVSKNPLQVNRKTMAQKNQKKK